MSAGASKRRSSSKDGMAGTLARRGRRAQGET
jgi:hypothetical protein